MKHCINCSPHNNDHRTNDQVSLTEEQNWKKLKDRGRNKKVACHLCKDHPRHRQANCPFTQNITLNSQVPLNLTAPILNARKASLTNLERFRDLLSEYLPLNYNIEAKIHDRDSQNVFHLHWQPRLQKYSKQTTAQVTEDLTNRARRSRRLIRPTTEPRSETATNCSHKAISKIWKQTLTQTREPWSSLSSCPPPEETNKEATPSSIRRPEPHHRNNGTLLNYQQT